MSYENYLRHTHTQFTGGQKCIYIIDQQTVRHFVQYSECLPNPLPVYGTKIVNPFINSRITANHDKGEGF